MDIDADEHAKTRKCSSKRKCGFKPVFDIPEPGEKGQAKNVKWMLRVNELRRIPAHPARERKYKIEDFEYIDYVYSNFQERLTAAQGITVTEGMVSAGEVDD